MSACGIFTINLVVNNEFRTRRVKLFSTRCFTSECHGIYERFLEANPEINRLGLLAVFSPEPITIHLN